MNLVVRLQGSVYLEGEDARIGVGDVPLDCVDEGWLRRINFVPQQIAIFDAGVPEVCRDDVLVVNEIALNLQVLVGAVRPILSGCGPVPRHLGGILARVLRDVASLTRDGIRVAVNPFIRVQVCAMTVGAEDLIFEIQTDRDRATADLMVLGLMTIGADHFERTHVNIEVIRGVIEVLVQISVLDVVATTPIKVAATAREAAGVADVLRDLGQIDPLDRITRRSLDIGPGRVVADEAIHFLLI